MGLLDIFRMGKVIAGTAKAIGAQRNLGRELAALPMERLVPECLACLNQPASGWEGAARLPHPDAEAIAQAKQLPEELAEFYRICDGFQQVRGEFPLCIYPITDLRLGLDLPVPLSSLLKSYWKENGNDSEQPGLLSILPPDDLMALAGHAADCYLKPSSLDLAVPLCPPRDDDVVVILLTRAGEKLPRGTVLSIEGGSATRYPSFKTWLGSYASLFGSLGEMQKSLSSEK